MVYLAEEVLDGLGMLSGMSPNRLLDIPARKILLRRYLPSLRWPIYEERRPERWVHNLVIKNRIELHYHIVKGEYFGEHLDALLAVFRGPTSDELKDLALLDTFFSSHLYDTAKRRAGPGAPDFASCETAFIGVRKAGITTEIAYEDWRGAGHPFDPCYRGYPWIFDRFLYPPQFKKIGAPIGGWGTQVRDVLGLRFANLDQKWGDLKRYLLNMFAVEKAVAKYPWPSPSTYVFRFWILTLKSDLNKILTSKRLLTESEIRMYITLSLLNNFERILTQVEAHLKKRAKKKKRRALIRAAGGIALGATFLLTLPSIISSTFGGAMKTIAKKEKIDTAKQMVRAAEEFETTDAGFATEVNRVADVFDAVAAGEARQESLLALRVVTEIVPTALPVTKPPVPPPPAPSPVMPMPVKGYPVPVGARGLPPRPVGQPRVAPPARADKPTCPPGYKLLQVEGLGMEQEYMESYTSPPSSVRGLGGYIVTKASPKQTTYTNPLPWESALGRHIITKASPVIKTYVNPRPWESALGQRYGERASKIEVPYFQPRTWEEALAIKPKGLGNIHGIIPEDVRTNLYFIGGGLALTFASRFLPARLGAVATIGGLGLAVLGVFGLLGPEPEEVPPPEVAPPEVPEEVRVPVLAPGRLAERISLHIDPTQPRTGGSTRSLYRAQEYEFVVKNDSASSMSGYTGLEVRDSEQMRLYKTSTLGRKLVKLAPRGQSVVKLSVPAMSGYMIFPQTVTVEAQLFRSREDAKYVRRSAAIAIKMSFLG